ncbi:WecB/TagA/CpsF family glycosyltransferase [Parasphingopyxis algicola]|uniref:WecB/TagA/CpsF family glycosyltransferase n=1 Tax=Parasphingopyxis algicola TaxID=2026624 RepID=UPI0015A4DF85|nr:WecB/TagA/CpsF family glycosyltransferase [Parasphingopyxis algicola]QLC25201.1 WecB/TagA/CpsF family glycosyltransferase [Parasphingopyxis algicola]
MAKISSELDASLMQCGASTLFGLPLLNATRAEAVDAIIEAAASGQRRTVNFVNAHCINVAHRDSHYARILKRSDLILPDGSGLALAAKWSGVGLGDNLNGTDVFPELCESAAEHGLPIFLLGGAPGVAAAAAEEMLERYPMLHIAGCKHGYHDESAMPDVIDMINRSRPAIVLVGLGVPRQEKWIAQYREALSAPVVSGVGGLFDYYSGRIPRAPEAMRRGGMEWVWRFIREPRRLAGRYLAGNPVFLWHAARHAIARRGIAAQAGDGAKRAIDVTIGSLALAMLAPIMAAIALLIKAEDGGSAFFSQTRIGKNGKPFKMLKFRSMAVDAEARRAALLDQSERDSVCFKMRNDPRITRVGKWLRRFSLDELPQIYNVVAGDMSLVGPRPALPAEVQSYKNDSWKRLSGRPGITCTWQVSGRANIPFDKQVELDVEYLSSRTLLRDIWLLTKTIPAVVSGRGAY